MLKLMRRYQKWLSPKEKTLGFEELLQELQALQADEFERKAFDYFNFIAWMESKVNHQSFESLIQLKQKGAGH